MVAAAIVITATSTVRASIGVIRPIVVIATTDRAGTFWLIGLAVSGLAILRTGRWEISRNVFDAVFARTVD
jgi:hypothetical protein